MIKSSKKCKYEGCESTKIWSGSFCRFHTPQKPIKKSNKPIKKISEKGKIFKEKKKEYTKIQFELFLEIWNERKHNCQSCGFWLGNEPKSIFFDHLIEKSKRKDLALIKENILVVCENCHSCKTAGFPTVKHLEYINKVKEKYGNR